MVDALGNPIAFHLTQGQACDLDGSDVLLPFIKAKALLADKAYDADERVRDVLRTAGKEAVIPSKKNRTTPYLYDRCLYKVRPLVENFFCKLKQYRAIARVTTKRPETSLPPFTSPLPSSGSIEDTP